MKTTFIEKSGIMAVLFTALLFIFPKNINIPNVSDLFTATTVLFAILTGFFIAAVLSNYFRLQSLIAEETSLWCSFYEVSITIKPKIKAELGLAIDNYLRAAFDFELSEYVGKTWDEFDKAMKVTNRIRKTDTNMYVFLLGIKGDLKKTRQEIFLTARKIMERNHWLTLIILATIIIFLVYAMRPLGVTDSILTVLISSVTCLVLFLLYDIDGNIFAEEKLAFSSFERAFKEIGKLPYYPEESIKSGRVKPKGKYRVGVLLNKETLKREIHMVEFK